MQVKIASKDIESNKILNYNEEVKKYSTNSKSNKLELEEVPETSVNPSQTFALTLFNTANKVNNDKAIDMIERKGILDEITELLRETAAEGKYSLKFNVSKYTDNKIIQNFLITLLYRKFKEMGFLVNSEANVLEISFLLN